MQFWPFWALQKSNFGHFSHFGPLNGNFWHFYQSFYWARSKISIRQKLSFSRAWLLSTATTSKKINKNKKKKNFSKKLREINVMFVDFRLKDFQVKQWTKGHINIPPMGHPDPIPWGINWVSDFIYEFYVKPKSVQKLPFRHI